jgi:hypothetical protein
VKAREHDQAFYASHFERLIWKALAMYYRLGAFRGFPPWEQICGLLDVKAEYTSPASRDRKQQADVNKILSDEGIMSARTFAADMGLDLDEEIANGAKKAPPEPSPFGAPGKPFGESHRLEQLAESALAKLAGSN